MNQFVLKMAKYYKNGQGDKIPKRAAAPSPTPQGFGKDDYETPQSALDMVLDELDPTKVCIWEPFAGTGYSSNYMRSRGFVVTNGVHEDFFDHVTIPPSPFQHLDIVVVTNPPFSKKRKILEKFHELGVTRIAILLPVGSVFLKYWRELFPMQNFQIIIHRGRCKFLNPTTSLPIKGTCNFDCSWFLSNLNLPNDITFKE